MIDPLVVMDKLATLECSDDVAEFLASEQITGGHSATTCPVAMYLRRETGQPVWIAHSVWGNYGRGEHPRAAGRPLPAPVSAFVRLYDIGAWPLLDNDGE